jgi:hypothetical protein
MALEKSPFVVLSVLQFSRALFRQSHSLHHKIIIFLPWTPVVVPLKASIDMDKHKKTG